MLYLFLILLNFILKGSISFSCCGFSVFIFIFTFFLYGFFDMNYSSYQFIYLKFFSFTTEINYCIGFGVDGLSFIFIWLTCLLFFNFSNRVKK